MERTQVDLEARDGDGGTPLHWAAAEGHLPVVQYLCGEGADKDANAGTGGDTTALGSTQWSPPSGAVPVRAGG